MPHAQPRIEIRLRTSHSSRSSLARSRRPWHDKGRKRFTTLASRRQLFQYPTVSRHRYRFSVAAGMSLAEIVPDHQLEELGNAPDPPEDALHRVTSHLPPADGGRAAWVFLLGCFVIEMFLWGFPFSFGVLQDYYANHEPISAHTAGISAVGTTCSVGPEFSLSRPSANKSRASCTSQHPFCSLFFNAGRRSAVEARRLVSLLSVLQSPSRPLQHLSGNSFLHKASSMLLGAAFSTTLSSSSLTNGSYSARGLPLASCGLAAAVAASAALSS